ncbi:hypothetical protein LINPERHAP2_LOCUS8212 [Linum perenne]
MNLGKFSITRAELRGVMPRLQLAWDRGYHNQLQLNSRYTALLLTFDGYNDHAHATTLFFFHTHELLQRDWEAHISHV